MRLNSLCAAGALAAIVGVAVICAAQARPLTPAEQRYARWQAIVPQCADSGVIGTIQSRFHDREASYWNSGLDINGLDNIRETGFRSTGVDYIPRRYCSAKAVMTDQKVREIYYTVGEDLGMTGTDIFGSVAQSVTLGLLTSRTWVSTATNWGVDWCIVGLDRNYAYGLNCKAARP